MNSFQYYAPTKVYFGPGTTDRVGEYVRQAGGSRVLVLYGGGSALRNGTLGRVTASLTAAGLDWVSEGGVQPNPRLALAQALVDRYQGRGIDFLLAVGGGSVLDTMKAVSAGLACGSPIWDFFAGRRPITGQMPMGSVLTIAAAGSEMSNSCVLTNEEEGVKKGTNTDFNRPLFAVMDPELTYTLPPWQTACGVTDIMMHTLERYFSTSSDDTITDAIAEALLRDVMEAGRTALAKPEDYHARSEIMWCGSLSHNDLTGLGHPKDFTVHQLGHVLSAKYDIAHGASLSVMWASWARFVLNRDPARFAALGRRVLGITDADDAVAAARTVDGFEAYWAELGMPVRFSQVPEIGVVSPETEAELADRCSWNGKRKVGVFRPIDREDMAAIYHSANC